MKILLAIILVLIISSLLMIESNNLSITSKEDMKTLSKKYLDWTGEIYTNIQKITGQAIKLDWLPE